MDLSGVKIKPAEGMVAVKFVDDDDDDSPSDEPLEYECLLAIVVGVGAKVKVKEGATVVTKPWARDGLCLGEGIHLINEYEIAATIG